MNKKRIFSSIFFVIILLIGAYFTMGAITLTQSGITITLPSNNTIIGPGNYTFTLAVAAGNSSNSTNWSLVRGDTTYVLHINYTATGVANTTTRSEEHTSELQ